MRIDRADLERLTSAARPPTVCRRCGSTERYAKARRCAACNRADSRAHQRRLRAERGAVPASVRFPRTVLPADLAVPVGAVAVPLTQGKWTLVDAADAVAVSAFVWCAKRDKRTWYARRRGPSGEVTLHRWLLDALPGVPVDHENRDGLDNRRSNLRLATTRENTRNGRLRADNTTGYRGVSRAQTVSVLWRAQLRLDGRSLYLGSFETTEEAARAYDRAARQYHGAFASLNFPEDVG